MLTKHKTDLDVSYFGGGGGTVSDNATRYTAAPSITTSLLTGSAPSGFTVTRYLAASGERRKTNVPVSVVTRPSIFFAVPSSRLLANSTFAFATLRPPPLQ